MSIHLHADSHRRKREYAPAKQDMAAMIDIVFLLLIFFVITVKPEDILAHLPASSPAPCVKPPVEPPPALLTIGVFEKNYVINGKKVTLESMEDYLSRIGRISSTGDVIVKCASNSSHSRLIRVLNLCEKTGFKKVSLFSY